MCVLAQKLLDQHQPRDVRKGPHQHKGDHKRNGEVANLLGLQDLERFEVIGPNQRQQRHEQRHRSEIDQEAPEIFLFGCQVLRQ